MTQIFKNQPNLKEKLRTNFLSCLMTIKIALGQLI